MSVKGRSIFWEEEKNGLKKCEFPSESAKLFRLKTKAWWYFLNKNLLLTKSHSIIISLILLRSVT